MSEQSDQQPRLLIFATQGTGHGDELRIVELTSKLSPQLFPFNRASKKASFRQLLSTLKRERPTLVIMEGTGIAGGAALILARTLYGVHYVVSSGDAIAPFLSMKKPLLGPIFRAYERWLYRLSSGFIGWTPYLVGRALTMGSPRGMTAAGWAPWSKTDAELAAGRARVRAQWNIPDDAVVFGIVGSLDWNDRVQFCYGSELVRAAVLAKRADLRVLIAGDGSGMQHLRQLAGDELGRTIILTGRVPREQVIDYLAAMDAGSLPQSVDGVGSFRYTIKLSEYLAARLPTVTGEIPLAYDLNDGWFWRLPGDSPWDPRYIRALADLMRTISLQQINDKRGRVPRELNVFDRTSQIERTTQFIGDICAALRA